MRNTLKKAVVVGASVLAFSGVAAGAAQAAPRQGADIPGKGPSRNAPTGVTPFRPTGRSWDSPAWRMKAATRGS